MASPSQSILLAGPIGPAEAGGKASFRNSPDARTYPKDHHVFTAGEPGRTMCAITRGRVAIAVNAEVAAELGAGKISGEMALLDGGPRPAGVVTLEEAELVEIGRPQFCPLVNQNPHVALQRMQLLTERLRHADALHGRSGTRSGGAIAGVSFPTEGARSAPPAAGAAHLTASSLPDGPRQLGRVTRSRASGSDDYSGRRR